MRRFNPFLLIFSLLSIGSTAHATPFSNLYVFGDSLSDVGNVFTATGNTPNSTYYTNPGHFTNGQVYAEKLWTDLGLSGDIAPSLLGGTDYAFGGARSRYGSGQMTEIGGVLLPPQVGDPATATGDSFVGQIASYLLNVGSAADPDALFIGWTGNNDVRDISVLFAINEIAGAQALFAQSISDVAAAFGDLIAAGAQHILVPTVTNLGLTPESQAQGAGFSALISSQAVAYNQAIDDALRGFTGVDIRRVDTFDRLGEVVADPAAFGLTNATDPCLSGFFVDETTGGPISTCAKPQNYAFWDIIHPGSTVHATLANDFRAAVPVPASLPLLLIGLATIVTLRRKA
jgi:phospholipase/lecithinase/hemolysin